MRQRLRKFSVLVCLILALALGLLWWRSYHTLTECWLNKGVVSGLVMRNGSLRLFAAHLEDRLVVFPPPPAPPPPPPWWIGPLEISVGQSNLWINDRVIGHFIDYAAPGLRNVPLYERWTIVDGELVLPLWDVRCVSLGMPAWLAELLLLAWPAWTLFAALRQLRKRRRQSLASTAQSATLPCPKCGYDLQGHLAASVPTLTCPECGSTCPAAPPATVPRRTFWSAARHATLRTLPRLLVAGSAAAFLLVLYMWLASSDLPKVLYLARDNGYGLSLWQGQVMLSYEPGVMAGDHGTDGTRWWECGLHTSSGFRDDWGPKATFPHIMLPAWVLLLALSLPPALWLIVRINRPHATAKQRPAPPPIIGTPTP